MRPFADLATPAWIGEQTGRAPPATYRLASPEQIEARALPDVSRVLAGVDGDAHVDETSGALRFSLPRAAVTDPAAFFGSLALLLDARHFQPVRAAWRAADPVAFEMTSRLPAERLDVIGPGGRVLAYHRAGDVVEGDISVRRRTERLVGRWRDAEAILEPLRRFRDVEHLAIDGRLGYFEASAAEAQDVLRPVFLFVVERPQPREAGAGWREAVVVPATDGGEIGLDAGLGEWSAELNGRD